MKALNECERNEDRPIVNPSTETGRAQLFPCGGVGSVGCILCL